MHLDIKNLKKEEKLIEYKKWSMDKFVINNKKKYNTKFRWKYHKWVRNSPK